MYTVTTTKATTKHETLWEALESCLHTHASAGPFWVKIAREAKSVCILIHEEYISVDDAEDIERLAGIDCHYWPSDPTIEEVCTVLREYE